MIIPVTIQDQCKIKELENKFPQLFVDFPVNRRLKENIFTQIFTILDNQEIVGCLIIDHIYERIELIQIEVLKDKQQKKYGTKLMEFLIQMAYQSSAENITLEVKETNYAAIHLYEKFGFQKVAKRKNYYQGIDAYLMERKMM